MIERAGLWVWVAIAVATTAFAGVPGSPEIPGILGSQDASEKGEQLLNGSCIRCHDLRPIEIQALDKDAWTEVVNAMNEKGAQVEKNDVPVLVDYLVRNHGPLPDGAGKKILLHTCTFCHDLKRVLRHGATREEWEDTLSAMLNEGAMLSDEDFPVLLTYLARNFKPQ